MARRGREILNKLQYAEYLDTRLKNAGKVRLTNPTIAVDNQAALISLDI